MKPIAFSLQVDYKSYMKLVFQILFTSGYVLAFYSAGIFSLFLVLYVYDIPRPDLTLLVIFIFVVMLVYPIRVYMRAKNRFNSTPSADEESFWKIDEGGIEIKSRSSVTYRGWDMFVKVTSNKHWIFIWFNSSQYTFFSKAAISEAELKEIKRLVFTNRKSPAK